MFVFLALWILSVPTARRDKIESLSTPWTDKALCLMKLCVEVLSIYELALFIVALLWLLSVGFEIGQGQAGEDDVEGEGKVAEDLIVDP